MRPATSDSSGSDSIKREEDAVPCSEALTKSYSLLFGLGQLTDELIGLHSIVSRHRPKRIRPYILFTLTELINCLRWWKPRNQMSLKEALALLRGEAYRAPKTTLLRRVVKFEKWLRSDRSTCEQLSFVAAVQVSSQGGPCRCIQGGVRCSCVHCFLARPRATRFSIPQIQHDK